MTRTCLIVDPDKDAYCGQPATNTARFGHTDLPVCDDHREEILYNELPIEIRYMERLDHAADAARKGIDRVDH